MAGNQNSGQNQGSQGSKGGRSGSDNRGLASADEETRKRVASAGGKARGRQRQGNNND